MKIVKVDNLGRDHISDILIAENLNVYYAEKITAFLNEKFGGNSSYFSMEEDDYKLYIYTF